MSEQSISAPMLPPEEWRRITDYPNYMVSDLGRIKSLARRDAVGRSLPERLLKIQRTQPPHSRAIVALHNSAGQKTCCVTALVAVAFLGPRPPGMVACHNNGDPFDNRLENIRYDTQVGNCADKLAHVTHQYGTAIGTAILTENDVREIRRRYAAGESQSSIATDFNTSQTNVSSIVRRETWENVT